MKIHKNKKIIQKMIIALVCIISLNFCVPNIACAAEFGGTLMTMVKDLVAGVGDVIMMFIQYGFTGEMIYPVDEADSGYVVTSGYYSDYFKDEIRYPIIQVSPELIFADEIEMLSIDFIGGTEGKSYVLDAENGGVIDTLRTIIASWYVTLRTIAIVGLLSVLIYVGIRIMISSTSQDRAKYKQRLVDWLIAFCLLFVMHYVMAGIINIVNSVNEVLVSACNITSGIPLNTEDYGKVQYSVDVSDNYNATNNTSGLFTTDTIDAIVKKLCDDNYGSYSGYYFQHKTSNDVNLYKISGSDTVSGSSYNFSVYYSNDRYVMGKGNPITFTDTDGNTVTITQTEIENLILAALNEAVTGTTVVENEAIDEEGIVTVLSSSGHYVNVSEESISDGSTILYFINYARLYMQGTADYAGTTVGYTIIYLVLAFYTVAFGLKYLKRVVYIAFLTLMAPLVALTYPLDKMRDGKAQAFNLWFKEYIYNILIQPFHLLIYTILVGTAVNLVQESLIYGVVAIGFMMPAEKLMRRFFGFENSGTLSAAGSFAGGAMFSSVMNRMNRPNGGPGGPEGEEKPNTIRQANSGGGGVHEDATLVGTAPSEVKYSGGSDSEDSASDSSIPGTLPTGVKPTGGGTGSTGKDTGSDGDEDLSRYESEGYTGVSSVGSALPKDGWKDEVDVGFFKRLNNLGLKGTLGTGFSMAGSTLGRYRYNAGKEGKRILKGATKSAGRYIRKAVVGGIPAAALGTMGLAMGVASGDLSKAAQYGALGLGTGYSFANYYGDKAAKLGGEIAKGGAKSASDAFWGDDAKKRSQYKYDIDWKKNPDNIDALTQELGSRSKAIDAMNNGSVQAFLNNNVTDAKKVARSLKLKEKYQEKYKAYLNNHKDRLEALGYGGRQVDEAASDLALNRAVSYAKWERDVGTGIYNKNSHARKTLIKQTYNQIINNNPNYARIRNSATIDRGNAERDRSKAEKDRSSKIEEINDLLDGKELKDIDDNDTKIRIQKLQQEEKELNQEVTKFNQKIAEINRKEKNSLQAIEKEASRQVDDIIKHIEEIHVGDVRELGEGDGDIV